MADITDLFERDDLQEHVEDGRAPVSQLFRAYHSLVTQHGWLLEIITEQSVVTTAGEHIILPIIALRTPHTGPAFWILAGVHGEEPAGPNALAQQIEVVAALGEKVPVVLLPLCNPAGYRIDWRYPDEKRDENKGNSVTDSDHLLPDIQHPQAPRVAQPTSATAAAITSAVLQYTATYPPQVVIDHHEDEELGDKDPYIYSQGSIGTKNPIAEEVVRLLRGTNMPLQMDGTTRFGEPIKGGVVYDAVDGSIDELLGARTIIVDGKTVQGPASPTVVIVETPTVGIPLPQRVIAHTAIISAYEKFWAMRETVA